MFSKASISSKKKGKKGYRVLASVGAGNAVNEEKRRYWYNCWKEYWFVDCLCRWCKRFGHRTIGFMPVNRRSELSFEEENVRA
jgi:hypothetical protein